MQYQSNADGLDIVSDVKFWCGIPSSDTTTYAIGAITRACNFALDRIVSLILRSDVKWEWDDNNQTGLPIGTTTLVAAQKDYSIPVTYLKIQRIRIKDANGEYYTLSPLDRVNMTDALLQEDDGQPRYYDLVGNSVFLYPGPASGQVTLAAGLELQFQRSASYFTTADTTKVPGFDQRYHRLISLYAALDFCEANGLTDRVNAIRGRIALMEQELVRAMTEREPEERTRIKPSGILFR